MRNFYQLKEDGDTPRPSAGAAHRGALQVVTLMFWTPCCAADLWLLATRGATSGAGFVFGLLFRQAIVFLALWFVAAFSQGMMRGSRLPAGPDARQRRRLRSYLQAGISSYVAPTRGNRGQ